MTSRRDVRETFDRIAADFSRTRSQPWPEVTAFLEGSSGSVGLDIGCGNGRHTAALAERCSRVVGLDLSPALCAIAAERLAGPTVITGDATALPLRDGTVDVALFVATIHHLPTPDLRQASLTELERVLTPDGRCLVSAWSTAADRFDATEGFDTNLSWTLPSGEAVSRYYHIFDPAEFESLLRTSPLVVCDSRVSSGNCYAVVASGEEERT